MSSVTVLGEQGGITKLVGGPAKASVSGGNLTSPRHTTKEENGDRGKLKMVSLELTLGDLTKKKEEIQE